MDRFDTITYAELMQYTYDWEEERLATHDLIFGIICMYDKRPQDMQL